MQQPGSGRPTSSVTVAACPARIHGEVATSMTKRAAVVERTPELSSISVMPSQRLHRPKCANAPAAVLLSHPPRRLWAAVMVGSLACFHNHTYLPTLGRVPINFSRYTPSPQTRCHSCRLLHGPYHLAFGVAPVTRAA